MSIDTKNPLYVVCFAALVSAAFTGAISVLQVATAGRVRLNEQLREKKALVRLFALGDAEELSDRRIVELAARRVDGRMRLRDPRTGETFQVLRAYKTEGEPNGPRSDDDLQAVAIPISGAGFWARIDGLLALSPDYKTILAVAIIDQSETPGLGGRITEESFLARFNPSVREKADRPALRATPPDQAGRFIHIGGGRASSAGDVRYARDVDAITGATQTSIRFQEIINRSLARFWRGVEAAPTTEGAGQ